MRALRTFAHRVLALIVPAAVLVAAIVAVQRADEHLESAREDRAAARDVVADQEGTVEAARGRRVEAAAANTGVLDAAVELRTEAEALVDLQREVADLAARQRDALLNEDAAGFNALLDEARSIGGRVRDSAIALERALRAYGSTLLELPPAACSATPSDTLDWVDYGGGSECAVLRVPLDHEDPDGDTITVTVARRPAEGPGRSLGPLLVNPGGPGGSGLQLLRDVDHTFPRQVLQRFDLVSFDPRGVGESTPVDCTDDLDAIFAVDQSPDDDAEWAALDEAMTTFVEGCEARSGDLLAHVGTADVARDMDRIRDELGVRRLNYVGFSYGSLLGAAYADLFPDRVRAFVLDGAVLPSRSATVDLTESVGLDDALEQFLADCSEDRSCAFHGGGNARIAFNLLRDDLGEEPLATDQLPVNETVAEIAVGSTLYAGAGGERELARALAAAEEGRGTPMVELFSDYVGRYPGGAYDNSYEALVAVNCLAGPERPTVTDVREEIDEDLGRSPVFGSSAAVYLACAHWPVDPVEVEQPHADGADPILVVGTTGDPVTPYDSAQRMTDQLDDAHLLTYRGGGHTAFGGRDLCVDLAVTAYLIDLTVPEGDGATCP